MVADLSPANLSVRRHRPTDERLEPLSRPHRQGLVGPPEECSSDVVPVMEMQCVVQLELRLASCEFECGSRTTQIQHH